MNFKSFSRSLEQFFLTVGQNNFGNKIPLFPFGNDGQDRKKSGKKITTKVTKIPKTKTRKYGMNETKVVSVVETVKFPRVFFRVAPDSQFSLRKPEK